MMTKTGNHIVRLCLSKVAVCCQEITKVVVRNSAALQTVKFF